MQHIFSRALQTLCLTLSTATSVGHTGIVQN